MGEMGESGDPGVRSVDHGKLLDYGLDTKVADQLEEIFQVGQAKRAAYRTSVFGLIWFWRILGPYLVQGWKKPVFCLDLLDFSI